MWRLVTHLSTKLSNIKSIKVYGEVSNKGKTNDVIIKYFVFKLLQQTKLTRLCHQTGSNRGCP